MIEEIVDGTVAALTEHAAWVPPFVNMDSGFTAWRRPGTTIYPRAFKKCANAFSVVSET